MLKRATIRNNKLIELTINLDLTVFFNCQITVDILTMIASE